MSKKGTGPDRSSRETPEGREKDGPGRVSGGQEGGGEEGVETRRSLFVVDCCFPSRQGTSAFL